MLFVRHQNYIALRECQIQLRKPLWVTVRDILFAGTGTTSGALEFAMLYLVLKPEVQDKLQQEIYKVIGHQRRPDYTDKDRWVFYSPKAGS